jgi:hypothetical protein
MARLHVDRGLHVLRYVSSAAGEDGPSVMPAVGSEAAGRIRLIPPPDEPRCELARPGACLVVVAKVAGTLFLEVTARGPQGSVDAVLRLELLQNAGRGDARAERSAPAAIEPFRLVAHLAQRGDVEITAGEWAGGPAAPAMLEGLTLLGRPVQARALTANGGERRWSSWAPAGTFLGSRGRSQPLVGLNLRMEADQDPGSELAIDCLFQGSPIVKKRGRDIEVVGPFANEPIVGLRMELVRADERPQTTSSEALAPRVPRNRSYVEKAST